MPYTRAEARQRRMGFTLYRMNGREGGGSWEPEAYCGLRQHFGPTNEKLAAFGMQPFRGRKRSKKTASPGDASGDAGGETP